VQQGKKYGTKDRTFSTYRGEKRERTDHSRRSTDDSPMFSAQCHDEKRNFDIDIPYELTYEFKPRTLNERLLWNALKQEEKKNKILQEEKNSIIMEHGKDTRVSDKVANTQPHTIT